MNRREFVVGSLAGLASTSLAGAQASSSSSLVAPDATVIALDLGAKGSVLPHAWEKCVGSDHAVQGLRDQWRQDLIRVHGDAGFQSVRFHGLFDDDMGIAAQGNFNFNFLYVDQVYDFMLEHGIKPYVELGFMPEAFASSSNRIFAYKGNVSPPRNWKDWSDMVTAFTSHCVKRYGMAEVGSWRFEVWNEPNITFWAGTQTDYFELYKQSAMAVKAVNTNLAVGGPATAQLGWIPDLITYCANAGVPIDFLSTHVYPNDSQESLFGKGVTYPFEQVIPKGLEKVNAQIAASKMPHLPLVLSEWGSQNPAFIVDTVKNCIGLTDTMSYWCFSNVFEEGGVPLGIFNSTYGLTDQWGIARPSLHAFHFLHRLGRERLSMDEGPVLGTRRSDGSYAILLWNLLPAKNASEVGNGNPFGSSSDLYKTKGPSRSFRLRLSGLKGQPSVLLSTIDAQTGTAIPEWKQMGSPRSPSPDQLNQLRRAAELPPPTPAQLTGGDVKQLSIEVAANSVVLIEINQ